MSWVYEPYQTLYFMGAYAASDNAMQKISGVATWNKYNSNVTYAASENAM